MKSTVAPVIPANCSPVFSIAGVMPGASEVGWTTAYPNPDAHLAPPRPAGHGPTFTLAGVVPGTPQTAWPTSMPDPTRDTLDARGYVITKVEAAALAELAATRADVAALRAARKAELHPAA
jgi:hypothetical protein